jgi:predicted nuclease of predicted toxin-antitoxin system
MALKFLVDMNLSPAWVVWFTGQGWEAAHWSAVGDPGATDQALVTWARDNHYTLFSHDLDFSRILALSNADGPSVIQIRSQDVLPDTLGRFVLATLQQFGSQLETGALLVIDEKLARVRILPLRQ